MTNPYNVIDTPEGVHYEPWTNGYAVGFKITTDDGRAPQYLYLNPSGSTDEGPGSGNVFVYHGWSGDPAADGAYEHYPLLGKDEVV